MANNDHARARVRTLSLLYPFALTIFFVGSLRILGAFALKTSEPSYKSGLEGFRSQIIGNASRWTPPQSGWLYVLDDNGTQGLSQVLLINPFERTTVGVIPVGAGPDMTLSPDGDHLYIASGAQGHTQVIDTETGRLESTFVTNRQGQLGGATFSSMIVSPDNRWLFVMEMTGAPPVPVNYSVATYDTYHDNEFVGQTTIPDCGVGRLAWIGEKLAVHCYDSDSVTIFNIDATGKITRAKSSLSLKSQTRKTASVSFLRDGESAAVFTDSGAVIDASLSSQANVPKTAELTGGRWINVETWPQSDDGRMIYLATGPSHAEYPRLSDEIAIFDTILWRYTDVIKTSVPVFSLALGKNAEFLYAISASKRQILIIDTAKRAEIGSISIPAAKPTLAIVAP